MKPFPIYRRRIEISLPRCVRTSGIDPSSDHAPPSDLRRYEHPSQPLDRRCEHEIGQESAQDIAYAADDFPAQSPRIPNRHVAAGGSGGVRAFLRSESGRGVSTTGSERMVRGADRKRGCSMEACLLAYGNLHGGFETTLVGSLACGLRVGIRCLWVLDFRSATERCSSSGRVGD